MTTRVVSGDRRTSAGARPVSGPPRHRLLRWLLAALLALMAGIGVAAGPAETPRASAAPPALSIRLSQASGDSRIGQGLELTAVVQAATSGQDALQNGWAVQFSGTANGGWTSGIVFTADGEATYVRVGEIAAAETITASIVNAGCGNVTSNSVVHEWWQPQISLTPVDSVSTLGTDYTVTANLHRNNAASMPGQRLTFTVQEVDFSSGEFTQTAFTDASGNASITWRKGGTTAIVEAIRVQETDQSEPARAGGSHVWDIGTERSLQIDLVQSSPDSRIGTELEITATARIGGAPAANLPMLMFSTETGALAGQQTDAAGVATFRKTATTAGPDNLLFYFRGVRGSISTLHEWWAAPTVRSDQSEETAGFLGRTRAPTATASFAGRPVAGAVLTLRATSGTANPVEQTATTNGAGRAAFDGWTRTTAGVDSVQIGNSSGSLTWVQPEDPPIAVSLRRNGPEVARVGEPVRLVATPTSIGHEGGPVALSGWDVSLHAAPSGAVLDTATSAADGAEFDPRQNAPGRLNVYASVQLPGCGRIISAVLGLTWALPELSFTQPDISVPAGRPVAVSARLSVAGRPIEGALLDFSAASLDCAVPDLAASGRTGEDGIATVTLFRDVPSPDRLTVREDDAVDPQSRDTTLTWGRPANPRTQISLQQDGPDGRVGTQVRLTARVTHFDGEETDPVPGVPVRFAGADTGATFVTGPDGTVTYSYRRMSARTDQVTASTPYGCDRVVSTPIQHEWWLPTLTLEPATATSPVGETASLRATLTHGGVRLAGIPLSFAVRNSDGAPDLPDGAQPGTVDGRSEFSWSRSIPGTDTITVGEVGVPLAVRTVATHRWESDEPVLSLTATPDQTTGTAGDPFTVAAEVELDGRPATGIDVVLSAAMPGQPELTFTATSAAGQASFGWTRPVEGTDAITVRATADGQTAERTLSRGWTVASVTSPSPSPSSPSPSVFSPSPSPSSSISPTPSPSPSESPTATPTPPKTIQGPQVGRPGGGIVIDGKGCRPGQLVIITLGDLRLGTVRAASDGTFQLQAVVPDLPLGRYEIRSSCGTTIGDKTVDITEPQVNRGLAGIAAAGATTASTFVFFVLLIKGVISFLPKRFG